MNEAIKLLGLADSTWSGLRPNGVCVCIRAYACVHVCVFTKVHYYESPLCLVMFNFIFLLFCSFYIWEETQFIHGLVLLHNMLHSKYYSSTNFFTAINFIKSLLIIVDIMLYSFS